MTSPPSIRLAAQLLLSSGAIAMLAACASNPPPTEHMAVAEAAVQRASANHTGDDAAGPLQRAVSKLEAARAAMARKDHVRARQLAEQVAIDAQVAELQAQAIRTGRSAAATQDAQRALKNELDREPRP